MQENLKWNTTNLKHSQFLMLQSEENEVPHKIQQPKGEDQQQEDGKKYTTNTATCNIQQSVELIEYK